MIIHDRITLTDGNGRSHPFRNIMETETEWLEPSSPCCVRWSKDQQWMFYPRKAWLVNERGYLTSIDIYGETSRSFLAGNKWRPTKYAKKSYSLISEDKAQEILWMERSRRPIADFILYSNNVSPIQLRQVAEIIGYEEVHP